MYLTYHSSEINIFNGERYIVCLPSGFSDPISDGLSIFLDDVPNDIVLEDLIPDISTVYVEFGEDEDLVLIELASIY